MIEPTHVKYEKVENRGLNSNLRILLFL